MDYEQFLPLFISESKDNLVVFEDNLVKLTPDADDDLVNTLFRAIHSIKGGAGMFNAPRLIEVAHKTESILDKVRDKKLTPCNDLIDVFFQAKDVIENYLDNLENGDDLVDPSEAELLSSLSQYLEGAPAKMAHNSASPADTDSGSDIASSSQDNDIEIDCNCLTIEIEQNAFMMGFRLEPLIQDVEKNHELISIDFDYHGPEFTEMNPIECYTIVKMVISPPMTEEQLEDLLSFSAGAEGSLSEIETNQIDPNSLVDSMLDSLLEGEGVAYGLFTDDDDSETQSVDTATEPQKEAAKAAQAPPQEAPKVAEKPAKSAKPPKPKGELIKVNSLKLDRLVDDVGELVSLKSQLKAVLQDTKDKGLLQLIKDFDKSLNDLRDTALALRLVPLQETLARFYRVVREAAKVTGKSIHLEIIGGQTELDRATVEKLVDPLTHIVRNSCDHGIEEVDARIEQGKSTTGNITIHAQYQGAGVSLKIIDDGKGLDKARILAKAKSSGVVAENEQLTDNEIYQLIFHPGLSTAEKVTDLSGRGVGMDVVRRNINQLGGDILIDSTPGKGTVLDIRLPLTTAILDGFLVKVGDSDLVVQMDAIIECMRSEELAQSIVPRQSCIELRGEYIPLISLASHLGIKNKRENPEGLMVNSQFGKVVLAIDHLVGEIQTVVKPLDIILQQSQLFSGIVKVAEGDIGFVLDINKLVLKIEQQKQNKQTTKQPN